MPSEGDDEKGGWNRVLLSAGERLSITDCALTYCADPTVLHFVDLDDGFRLRIAVLSLWPCSAVRPRPKLAPLGESGGAACASNRAAASARTDRSGSKPWWAHDACL